MFKYLTVCLAVFLLAACGATASFTRGMTEPIKVIDKSASIVDEAESSLLKAIAAGRMRTQVPLPDLICAPQSGPTVAFSNLSIFTDAFSVVQDVGEKPDDTSYSGYMRQFRRNADAMGSDDAKQQSVAKTKQEELKARCIALFLADAAPETRLATVDDKAKMGAFFAQTLAVDGVLKALLAQGERAQREAAVRATIVRLIPMLRQAAEALRRSPGSEFGPLVNFPKDSDELAKTMNGSVLGAAITIRRWYLATQISEQWNQLQDCRNREGNGCLGGATTEPVLESFAVNVRGYRALSQVDSKTVLAALDTAITAAQDSLDAKAGIVDLIDSLVMVSDSFTSLSDAYDAYEKSK